MTEKEDHLTDAISSSSDESTGGCIHWCKKESGDNETEPGFSSVSGSAAELKSFQTSSEEDDDDVDDETDSDVSIPSAESDSDIQFGEISEENTTKKDKRPITPHFYLGKKDKTDKFDTDDSVIFADNSSEHVKTPSSGEISLKNKELVEDSYEDYDDEEEDELDDEEDEIDEHSKVRRQFIYIQMEYCGGKTLKYLIEQGLYNDEEKVWCLLREILQGLNHIHEQGMIHRDLKPGNVLIDRDGHAKLADFGLATSKFLILDKTNETGENIGLQRQSSVNFQDPNTMNSLNSQTQNAGQDSISLSGAVGTALYVAPELLVPFTKNKFFYTQVKNGF